MSREDRPKGGFDGSRLTAARERLGLTRTELARRLETEWEVVLQWETGECRPRPRSIPAIAAAVGVAIADLYHAPTGAATLAQLRVAAGLNQTDIARALGVSRATVSQWERGTRPVPAKYHSTYRRLLGLTHGGDANLTVNTGRSPWPPPSTEPTTPSTPSPGLTEADTPGPDSIHTPKGNAARVAHLIVISDLEYADGTFLSADRPKNWHVYSPQGVDVNKTGAPVLDELMEEAAIRLAKMGYRQMCLHAEQRIIIDDEPLRVVRVQTSPPSDARLHTSRLFLSQFTPEFYREGVGEDLEQKARIRKDFERDFPQSATGEMLFVVAESTDSYGWLQDQTLPYMPYTIVAHLPEADRHFFASVYYDHVGVKTGAGLVSFDELGIQRDTTVGEFAQRLDEHHRRSTSLPAAGRQ
ncbi:helix-turn-helix domain-containing protein [Mycolicibacterium septicum]|uniref:Helix-turn-helix transcriptional regulator n=2 Tax=Mycolicibacterium septicum TaxID=98668 RepID=A0A7X6MJP0_9MYCO|nr:MULTISPECIES: helix-turn-helix transcriptional regulator [Mycolicibacterium]MCW1824047.1 helix-turn-helix domain-containing protein [Mycolicibacterium senegalense]NKZ10007.1 helix-turn-helix transcriptional regulator [Mycolicibacterium septicum DSM 44393]